MQTATDIPASVTALGGCFDHCTSLNNVTITVNTTTTAGWTTVFYGITPAQNVTVVVDPTILSTVTSATSGVVTVTTP